MDAYQERFLVFILSFETLCTIYKKINKYKEKFSNFAVNRDHNHR